MNLSNYRPKKKIEKVLTFFEKGTFESMYAANRWCINNGYSYGSTCFRSAVGLKKGDYLVAKWKNLTKQEIDGLDGIMFSDDFREGTVRIHIYGEVTNSLKLDTAHGKTR